MHMGPSVELDESPLDRQLRGALRKRPGPFRLQVAQALPVHLVICCRLRHGGLIQDRRCLQLLLRHPRYAWSQGRRQPHRWRCYDRHEHRDGKDLRGAAHRQGLRSCSVATGRDRPRSGGMLFHILEAIHGAVELLSGKQAPELLVQSLPNTPLHRAVRRLSGLHCSRRQDLLNVDDLHLLCRLGRLVQREHCGIRSEYGGVALQAHDRKISPPSTWRQRFG
mmetsp:Transcript_132148/g.313272  ORF Transcript_132148/g.313272 Transcript_132148/m.313272 type:complete len:222 (-) Transcript_132148:46-711(-)